MTKDAKIHASKRNHGDWAGSRQLLPPIVSFVGHSGSGKTTFIEKLIPQLNDYSLKVATIKHHMHDFEMDKPGKDTWRHKKAGAVATIISSPTQIGMVMDTDYDRQPAELAQYLGFADLIITEGYKQGPHHKIEVYRPTATGDRDLICRHDPNLLAIVSDIEITTEVPRFALDDIKGVAALLESKVVTV